jgi:antitoxin component of MazEF toxin-antitoxin module
MRALGCRTSKPGTAAAYAVLSARMNPRCAEKSVNDVLIRTLASRPRVQILTPDTLRVYIRPMTKKLIRHGNSAALVLDKALLDLLKVRMNTPLEVTTDGKNIIISPQVSERAEATLLEALERINLKHGAVLSKLGK